MNVNYAETTGHPADFDVRYRFYGADEGGRRIGPPFQGFCCDWLYDGDDIAVTGLYCIWPLFLSEDGGAPLQEREPVAVAGTASMWILSHEFRVRVHRNRIVEGVKGYFMEGSHRVAKATVSRVVGLHTNGDPDPLGETA